MNFMRDDKDDRDESLSRTLYLLTTNRTIVLSRPGLCPRVSRLEQ